MILAPDDWNDGLYIRDSVPNGFRIIIDPGSELEARDLLLLRRSLDHRILQATSPLMPVKTPGSRVPKPEIDADESPHICGGVIAPERQDANCPNCHNPLFPIFQFDLTDEKIASLFHWQDRFLSILVCPFCFLYMEPYWVDLHDSTVNVVGGLRDGGKICNRIAIPYESRRIKLRKLEFDDYPLSDTTLELLDERQRAPGIYHQIGGLPPFQGFAELSCFKCKHAMEYGGVVDYDDENIPLFETDQTPVALIFGDMLYMNFFICPACSVVGYKLAK
jgi:hypothetical protein